MPPDYQVMGEDGHEYGPVSAEKIRAWVAEQRLERKSPVRPPGARDWVFLESLPEFAGLFATPAPPPKRRLQKWPLAILIVLAAGLVVLVLKKIKNH